MFGKLSAKACATLLFIAGLLVSLALAYHFGTKLGWDKVLVPVEKIKDAPPTVPAYERNIPRTVGVGAAVCSIGTVISFAVAELYYSLLEFLRRGQAERRE